MPPLSWPVRLHRSNISTNRKHRALTLRLDSLESRIVPAGALDEISPPVAEKVQYDGPPILTAPAMTGLDALDISIASAVQHAWQVPAGTRASEWLIQLPTNTSPDALQALGTVAVREVPFWPNAYAFTFAAEQDVAGFPAVLAGVTDAEFYYPIVQRLLNKRFVPNDTLFPQQWHLSNTGQGGGLSGEDANLVAAWDVLDLTGQVVRGGGVTIGVVDDGLQRTHPDIAPNYSAADSFDFNSGDSDPSPDVTADLHGTAAAGVAAARGNNGLGVSGSAPLATLSGLRLIAAPASDLQEADALGYRPDNIDIYSNSWGPADNGTLGFIGAQALSAIQNGATTGRGGLGNIYTWAAGNGLGSNDNVNYDAYANSRHVIAVGAITDSGQQANYSEPGAPMLVTAYSGGGSTEIYTTDLAGASGYNDGFNEIPDSNYTNSFSGTSSATPLVSGVVALMLDANPDLTARDVQHILVRTARKNDPSDPGWANNSAGFHVNHKYGFGAIDALAAVQLAKTWNSVSTETLVSPGMVAVNTPVPENDPIGVTSTVSVSQNMKIEHVEVVFNATQSYRGDYRIVLTAPSGTQSVLAETHSDAGDNYSNWVFSSVRHWGESSVGTWTLKVSDEAAQDIGDFQNWTLRLYGTPPGEAPGLSGIESSAVTYIAGQGPLNVTQSLTVADVDSASLNGATIAVSNNYVSGQDFLRFTDQNGITGVFSAGTLTLTGLASLAAYQTALHSVRYENTSLTPSTAVRTVRFNVTDPGGLVSSNRSRNISISLVNKQPTLTALSTPPSIDEDAGLQTRSLDGISAGAGENQLLTVTAESSNPGLIPNPTVTYTSPSANGSLSYTPVANQFGSATITVKVKDTGGTANGGLDEITRTFVVNVTSINDAPTFTKGADQFSLLGSGARIVPDWATNVSSGPPNESSQTLTFQVSNDNNALFTTQPAIAPDGTLTYDPFPAASGTATVTVTLMDSGSGQNTSAPQTFTISVDLNSAPVVDANITTKLTTIPRNSSNPAGDPVSLVGGNISDPNAGQPEGIAVVGLSETANGAWQYSLNAGVDWQPFGTVSLGSARLLGVTDFIRFVPVPTYLGSPEITYHAWDQTSDAPGDVVDLTVGGSTGGTTAFSIDSGKARLRVATTLVAAEDDKKSKGDTVLLLLGSTVSDPDGLTAKRGMAITQVTGTAFGVWQYSNNNGRSWKPIGPVSLSSAFLVGDKDKLRFLGNLDQFGQATFTFHAWDQSSGTRGKTANLSAVGATGGGTAFSQEEDTGFAEVFAVNDRPVLDKLWQPTLATITDFNTPPPGETVSSLIDSSITDPDAGSLRGIAVVGTATPNGAWQYRLNGVGSFIDIGPRTVKTALLLAPTDEIRFLPKPGFIKGTVILKYRGWDQTTGTSAIPADTTRETAYSTQIQTAKVKVGGSASAANSAPVLDNVPDPVLLNVAEDAKSAGDTVALVVLSAITDADAGALSGIAVTGLGGTSNGRWQFSTNNGAKYTDMVAISESHALLLRSTDKIKFVPNKDFNGTATITFRAWDRTQGSQGQYANLTLAGATGGSSAFSTALETAQVTVTPVNDAPVISTSRISLFTPQAPAVGDAALGDTVATLIGSSITDVDTGNIQGIAVTQLTLGEGAWQYKLNGSPDWVTFGPVTNTTPFLLGPTDRIRFFALDFFQGIRQLKFRAWDQSVGTAGTTMSAVGSSAFSKLARTGQVTITTANDRPILDTKTVLPMTPVLSNSTGLPGNTAGSLLGNSILDPDGAGPQGIAINLTDSRNGSWSFSIDGGANWNVVGTVSKNSALLLRSEDLIRFIPNAGFTGTAKISYQAWDQSTGTKGTKVNTGTGGITSFSLLTATSTVVVNAAPILDV